MINQQEKNNSDLTNIAGLKYLPKWPPVNIDFKNLVYSVPDLNTKSTHLRKRIIRNVSGQFRSNELTAIMGASGCGKSSLLNILAGYRVSLTSGEIYINGQHRKIELFKKISRYIMQNEEFDKFSTVRESMIFAANLKLGNKLKQIEKYEIIEEILDNLNLRKVENTINTKLSGGEKKRLSIAMELVNNPPVIFLDEPTTGLDDLSSSQCISMLKLLAKSGRTIICSIHTPSAKLFQLFNNVYILADGQCCYQGSVDNIIPFLDSIGLPCPLRYNPADFIIEVSCGEYGKNYIKEMIKSVDNGKLLSWIPEENQRNILLTIDEIESTNYINFDIKNIKSPISSWRTFCLLVERMLVIMWRDKTYMQLRFIMMAILAILVGGIFQNAGSDATKAIDNFGFAYTIMFYYVYFSIMPILSSFPIELQLVKREYFNQWYQLGPYYFAFIFAKIPFMLFLASIYITSIYIMSDQPMELERFVKLFAISILTGLVSDALGIIIGSRFSIVNGLFVGPAIVTPCLLLSNYGFGFGIRDISIYMKIAMNSSYLRHSLLGVMAALYSGDRKDTHCPETEIFCVFKKSKVLMKSLGTESADYLTSVVYLIMFLLLFSLIGFLSVRHRLTVSHSNFSISYYIFQLTGKRL